MDNKYVINESTLEDIADAIREQDGTSEEIDTLDYASRIRSIDLSTEDYMRLSDLLEYPISINEDNYTESDINKTDELIEHFATLGDDTNGE